jgi:hypothetical protein
VRSTESVSIKQLRKWKEDTRAGGNREIPETSHKRKSNIRIFTSKRKRQYKATE